jgi:mycothiol synthase
MSEGQERFSFPQTPPALAGLRWRKLAPADLPILLEIQRAGLDADGGLPFLFVPEIIESHYFPDQPGAAIGAFGAQGALVACAAIHLSTTSEIPKAAIVGMVHPEQRGKGLGSALLQWSMDQARQLLAHAVHGAVLQISTESLTNAAQRLYLQNGFHSVMEEVDMRFDLRRPLPDSPLPPDVTLSSWRPELAEEFYRAYFEAFRERPGFPGWSAAEWIEHVTDNDHMPEWSLLARVNGVPGGFVIGDIDLTTTPPGGYVWQIGVVPAQRRRGLATALLVKSMQRMQAAGALEALLCVHVNNPGAFQAYAQLGFTSIGRRARYERAAE